MQVVSHSDMVPPSPLSSNKHHAALLPPPLKHNASCLSFSDRLQASPLSSINITIQFLYHCHHLAIPPPPLNSTTIPTQLYHCHHSALPPTPYSFTTITTHLYHHHHSAPLPPPSISSTTTTTQLYHHHHSAQPMSPLSSTTITTQLHHHHHLLSTTVDALITDTPWFRARAMGYEAVLFSIEIWNMGHAITLTHTFSSINSHREGHFSFNDLMLSKQAFQGADLVNMGGKWDLRFL